MLTAPPTPGNAMTDEPRRVARPQDGSRPCGLTRRLLVMVYDAVALVAVLMLAAAIALPLGTGDLTAGRDPLYTLYLGCAWFGYLSWCWRRGMTLGMRAWRVSIQSADGGRPTWKQCGVRFGCSLLSAAAGGLGFLHALVDPQRRTWHDIASRTHLRHEPKRARPGNQTDRRSA